MRNVLILAALMAVITHPFMLAAMPVMAEITVDEITSNLKCQCGCTMIVKECNCEEAARITSEVSSLVQQGKSEKQIIKELKTRYGNEILATPEKEGFDLSLWILPGVGVLIGGLLIYLVINKSRMSDEDIFELEYQEFITQENEDEIQQ